MSVKVQITSVRLEEGEKKQRKGASTQSGAIYYSRFLRHAGPLGFRFRFITFLSSSTSIFVSLLLCLISRHRNFFKKIPQHIEEGRKRPRQVPSFSFDSSKYASTLISA